MSSGRIVALLAVCYPLSALADAPVPRVIEFLFTPTARTQIALWIEKPDGTFVKTVGLTEAVARRGIGNRPGAFAMNSGFHWPYGRREGTLPIWGHRRAAAAGAAQFKRVIFQNRFSEGYASRTTEDSTPESYFCLAFAAQNAPLDAVSCASGFNSDKGRYIQPDDVSTGYSEPLDTGTRPLDLVSLYPPRRDVTQCATPGCVDTPDTATYADHARQVMPDIDSVTMATPPGGDREQSILFPVPDDWPNGDYLAWAEVNTENDSNASYTFDIPQGVGWDSWAETSGYSYRGQPSVAFKVAFSLGAVGTFATTDPAGYGDVGGFGPMGGTLHEMDATMTNDPNSRPGSGVDRFRFLPANNYRFKVAVRGGSGTGGPGGAGTADGGSDASAAGNAGATESDPCRKFSPPSVPMDVTVTEATDPKHSHEWGHLRFVIPASLQQIHHYEVRISETEITTSDPETFARAHPANAPKVSSEMLIIPTTGAAGSSVDADFGQLLPVTRYWVAVRAVNICAVAGPYEVGTFTTTRINFTKLSGCFIATAAYGSALEPEVESLRRVRDGLRPRSPLFAAATDLYYRSGPAAAAVIARSDAARAVVRMLLAPVVKVAQAAAPAP